MLAHSDLTRSISNMTIGLARAASMRRHAADAYALAEREQQFQYNISGKVGTVPVEKLLTIPFDVVFLGDAGMQRDSQLGQPQVRSGFEIASGPAGLIPYAHVNQWVLDDDLNYTGAKVTVGVHAPAIAVEGAGAVTSRSYRGVLHMSFQGYGAPWDPDGPSDAGGNAPFPEWDPSSNQFQAVD